MKGYSPSTELLNLYDTTREKPFEFMHSRSFVNINVATGWTVSQGGQFPYENVITLPVDEGDFPITMEYQPTAIIQPNANESCAPSNFPYIETTRQNQVTLYAYSIPSPTSMLPIVINLTQNGSPHGSTNAAAQRSTVEQTMIQLSQNYFLVEVVDEVLTKNTTITFDVTAYKGGERVSITPPADQPEYAITNQDGNPILNPSGGTYPSVTVEAAGDKSVKVTIKLLKDTFIKNGIAIIQFPVQAGGVFYPRATINAIASTAILEQVDSYDLSFGTLTRSSDESFFVDGKALSETNKWIIKATKRTLNGVVSSVSSGTIKFTDVEKGTSYFKSLSSSQLALKDELGANDVFKASRIRIDLEIGGKVVESKFVNIIVSVFSTLIQPSVEYIVSGSTNNIRFSSFTLLEGGMIVPKHGTLTIYKNSVSEENKLISEDNVNEINYSLIPTESFNPLEGVGSFIATFAETIGGEVTQQRVIPVVGGTGEPDLFSLVASPVVLMVDVDKDYVLKSNPVSTLKVYRNGSDVTGDFTFAAVSDGGTDFGFDLDDDSNQLTVTEFGSGASQIVGVTITAENKDNPNIKAIGSLQAIRQMEDDIIDYYTYIRYTSNVEDDTDITESIVEDTKYMGLAITTTPTAPTDKGEYNWTPVAQDGRGIKSTDVYYAQNDSGTEWPEPESDLWGDFPTPLIKGEYLWTKTKTTYTDDTFTYTYNVSYIAIDGPKGDKGDTGDRGPAGPVLIIEAPDGLAFSEGQTKSIRLNAKLMDEDTNRIGEYTTEEIRWERSSSDYMGDILFASTTRGPSIYIDPQFLNVPATYTCFISKIIEDNLTVNGDGLTGKTLLDDELEVISVKTYSPVIYTAHVTTSLEISEEIKKIEKVLENIEKNSVTTSDFERTQNRIFGSVAEVITTTADLVTRVDGVKTEVERQVLKQEALTSELDMTSTRIRGEVKALSDKGDKQYAYLQLKSDSIETKVGKVGADLENQIEDFTQFMQNENEFRLTVQNGGGSNLIKNSAGYKMIEDKITKKYYPAFWAGSGMTDSTSTWILNNSTAKHGFQLRNALCGQRVELKPHTEYTIRFILKTPPGTVNVLDLSLAAASHSSIEDEHLWELEGELILTDSFDHYEYEETVVHRYEKTFTTSESPAYILAFNSQDESNTMELADLGIYEGTNVKGWQQHSGETYTLNVQVDEQGLTVYSTDKKSKTVMSPEEFSGYYHDEKVFTLNGSITEVQGLEIEKEGLHIAPIKMIRNDARKSLIIVWTGGV